MSLLNATQAIRLREKIMFEMSKLGRGATGPSTRVLARLTGTPEISLLSVLQQMERDHMITGRKVKQDGPTCWVPYGHDRR